MSSFKVKLTRSATRSFRKLPTGDRPRIRKSLETLASDVARGRRIEGKRVKTIRGSSDMFHRLRVGDYRVLYDSIVEDRVVLVLGIVHRRDLETWLRNR